MPTRPSAVLRFMQVVVDREYMAGLGVWEVRVAADKTAARVPEGSGRGCSLHLLSIKGYRSGLHDDVERKAIGPFASKVSVFALRVSPPIGVDDRALFGGQLGHQTTQQEPPNVFSLTHHKNIDHPNPGLLAPDPNLRNPIMHCRIK